MSDAALTDRVFTADEFLEWHEEQEDRYGPVRGRVVREFRDPETMMTGVRKRHNVAVAGVLRASFDRVHAAGCDATIADTAVRVLDDRVRHPDLVIGCAPQDDDASESLAAPNPTLVLEVLSSGTKSKGHSEKLTEYRSAGTIETIVLIDPRAVFVEVHRRMPDDPRSTVLLHDLDADADLGRFGPLALTSIHQGPSPKPALRVV